MSELLKRCTKRGRGKIRHSFSCSSVSGNAPPYRRLPAQAKSNSTLYQPKRPARFTNGLEAPERIRPEMPRGISRMRFSFPFSYLVVAKTQWHPRVVDKGSQFLCCLFSIACRLRLPKSPLAPCTLGSSPGFGRREAESENRMFDQPIIIIGNFLLL